MSMIKRWCRRCGVVEEIEIKEWDWWTEIRAWICPGCEWEEYLDHCERELEQ